MYENSKLQAEIERLRAERDFAIEDIKRLEVSLAKWNAAVKHLWRERSDAKYELERLKAELEKRNKNKEA